MLLDVREYLPKIEGNERLFVKPRNLNKKAAAYRYAVVDKFIGEWFNEINSEMSDTREMPSELIDMYEEVYKLMTNISRYEQDIVIGVK